MSFLVKATEFEVGKVYNGTPIGYYFKDTNGKYWWRRVGGELQEITPHPDALFYAIDGIYDSDQNNIALI